MNVGVVGVCILISGIMNSNFHQILHVVCPSSGTGQDRGYDIDISLI